MKRLCGIFIIILIFTLLFAAKGVATSDLSIIARVELEDLKRDISKELKQNHEITGDVKEMVLAVVKLECEQYYADQGIQVTWAWYGSEYKYTKNKDLFTLVTHLDYKDSNDKGQRSEVHGEVFHDDQGLSLTYLQIKDHVVIDQRSLLPEDFLTESSPRMINSRTGINLSELSKDQLNELDKAVKGEIDTNHTPKGSINNKVKDLVKNRVEDYYNQNGIQFRWPLLESHSYTNDWGCYTETTNIIFKDDEGKDKKISIYAEIFPENDIYDVYFLKIGTEVIIDNRAQLASPACRQFLNSRDYLTAVELERAGQDEQALAVWQRLSDFTDSPKRVAAVQGRINSKRYNQAKLLMLNEEYEEAVIAFSALNGYLDSAEQLSASMNAILKRDYQAAMQWMETEQYEKAISAFEALDGYTDSLDQIAACKLAIQNRDYQAAKLLMDDKRYEEALNAFMSLGDFSDSVEQTKMIRIAIKEQAYSAVIDLLDAFQYKQALVALMDLDGYLDSAEKISYCEIALASIDRLVELSDTEASIYIKGSYNLKPVATPTATSAPKKTQFVFLSTNEQVVKVNKNGIITGVSAGDTYITFTAKDNPYVGGRLHIKVLVPVSSLSMSAKKLNLQLSSINKTLGSGTLSVTVSPENVHSHQIEWSSSNEKIAIVNQEGIVQAIGIGQATITATSSNTLGSPKKATCVVSISQATESVSIVNADDPFYVGKITALKTKVLPAKAPNKSLTWTSSDTNIATVSSDGKVKGVAQGVAIITAQSTSGVSAVVEAKVEMPPTILRVSGKAKMTSNDHVGNSWTKEFIVNDSVFTGTKKIGVNLGDAIELTCWLTENDTRPDSGRFFDTIEMTEEILKKGITISGSVSVSENGGRYSGNTAAWEVTFIISP